MNEEPKLKIDTEFCERVCAFAVDEANKREMWPQEMAYNLISVMANGLVYIPCSGCRRKMKAIIKKLILAFLNQVMAHAAKNDGPTSNHVH